MSPQELEAKRANSRICEVKITRNKGKRISDAKIAKLFILILLNCSTKIVVITYRCSAPGRFEHCG